MDVEKTIEFLVSQQAQFHANLEAQQAQAAAQQVQFAAQIEKLTAVTGGQYTSLLVGLGHLAQTAKDHEERLSRVTERLDLVGEKVDKLHEDVAMLFKIVDDLIRRNNGGHAQ